MIKIKKCDFCNKKISYFSKTCREVIPGALRKFVCSDECEKLIIEDHENKIYELKEKYIALSFRQGDIYLKKVETMPQTDLKEYKCTEGEEQKGAIVLAHGESTGHKHAIYDGNAILVKEKDSNRFFLIVVKITELKHEEHDSIKLPVGTYEVIRQREYSPNEIKRVAD